MSPSALSVLTRAPAADVKALVEALLPELGDVSVLQNRTGIVMLPATDSVQGTQFHLGEVLVAEAQVRLHTAAPDNHTCEGYAACLGRDVQQALALAILDAALRARQHVAVIDAFVLKQHVALQAADAALMQQVESTRVEMETF